MHDVQPRNVYRRLADANALADREAHKDVATDRFILVGSSGSNQNTVQEYNAGACTSVTMDPDQAGPRRTGGGLLATAGHAVQRRVRFEGGAT